MELVQFHRNTTDNTTIKEISTAPIFHTEWNHRALYNSNSNTYTCAQVLSLSHTHKHTHTHTHTDHSRGHRGGKKITVEKTDRFDYIQL